MRLILPFLALSLTLFSFDGWVHLELGAANYGPPNKRNKTNSKDQLYLLFWTAEQLVEKFGPKGVICVNDLEFDITQWAVDELDKFLTENAYHQIETRNFSGDYTKLDFTSFIREYGKELFDSIHLKNPEANFFGKSFTKQSRQSTRKMLKQIANQGTEGLFLFLVDNDSFIPQEEKNDWMEREIFYQKTNFWQAINYRTIRGKELEGNVVYFIPRHAHD